MLYVYFYRDTIIRIIMTLFDMINFQVLPNFLERTLLKAWPHPGILSAPGRFARLRRAMPNTDYPRTV
jgi:hypothetical protein